jgi:transcription elongation factor Elf1
MCFIGSARAKEVASLAMSRFKDAKHLLGVGFVFAAGVIAFVLVRAALVPRSFGEYGHYRGNAIKEIATQPVAFAGQASCEICHSDVATVKNRGKHASVNCEACHGALAKHADDPGTVQAPKLDTAVLCVRCHSVNGAKPKNFPQVAAKEHSAELPCETCHQPHSPLIGSGGKP